MAEKKEILEKVRYSDEELQEFKEMILKLPFPMLEFLSGITPVPIVNKYRTPKTLGSDRLAAAVAAEWLQPGRNVLIIDVGTCITYDYVNAAGEYKGGNISPGPTIRFRALNQFTGRLPFVDREGVTPPFGNTTITAIRSGVIRGVKYEIEGYVHLGMRFKEKFPIFAYDFLVPR